MKNNFNLKFKGSLHNRYNNKLGVKSEYFAEQ